ncbi:hypothetical protein [Streptomyces sp. NPDC002467]|uniref:hypothetical protein n=1 Tax=Streptomyces sp. NPDC002467 TaxID=3364647 RepID=UPI00369E07B8
MATDRLAEITGRLQAATKGTWGTYYDGAIYHLAADMRVLDDSSGRQIGGIPDGDDRAQAFNDAMFIGRAHDDVAFLLGLVADLDAKLRIAEGQTRDRDEQLTERTRQLNGLLDSLSFDERAVPR